MRISLFCALILVPNCCAAEKVDFAEIKKTIKIFQNDSLAEMSLRLEELIKHTDINKVDVYHSDYRTLLEVVCFRGVTEQLDKIKLLLSKGIRITDKSLGWLAASRTSSEAISYLLQNGAHINGMSNAAESCFIDRTPLQIAAVNRNYITLKTLVQAGAHLNVKDKDDYTVLHWLAIRPNFNWQEHFNWQERVVERQVISFLLSFPHIDTESKTKYGHNAWELARSVDSVILQGLLFRYRLVKRGLIDKVGDDCACLIASYEMKFYNQELEAKYKINEDSY